MQCLKPVVVKGQAVACGQCIACRVNRTDEWATRILHEARLHCQNVFVTFTYNAHFLPKPPSISKRELQTFFKRLRKAISPRKILYFACGEYGEIDGRPHYHAIIFGMDKTETKIFMDTWQKGFVYTGDVNMKTARYCAKYIQKILTGNMAEFYEDEGIEREFMLCSKRPAIGKLFATQYIEAWMEKGYIVIDGLRKAIPRYYLNQVDPTTRSIYANGREEKRFLDDIRKAKEAQLSYFEYTTQQAIKEKKEREGRELNLMAKLSLKKSEVDKYAKRKKHSR